MITFSEARKRTIDELPAILDAAEYISRWIDDEKIGAKFAEWYAKNAPAPNIQVIE